MSKLEEALPAKPEEHSWALRKISNQKQRYVRWLWRHFRKSGWILALNFTEGMCNAAYLVKFSDGSKSILKIAPGESTGLLSNEVNMMDAEVKAMNIVRKSNSIRVAEVQYYDTSKTICSGDYFFMEVIEGQSFFTVMESMSEEEKR